MNIKTNKFIAVLCAVAIMVSTLIPMFSVTAIAADATATLDFTNSKNNTSISASEQSWTENGITITNLRGSSTTKCNNYTPSSAGHARFYKDSNATVTCSAGKITSIVFTCTASKYAGAPTVTGGTAATSGTTVTITMNSPADSVYMVFSGSQIRAKNITVTYEPVSTSACTHANKTNETITTPATCLADGESSFVCGDCGETITETIEALGHNYVDNVCTRCSAYEYTPVSVPEALTAEDDALLMVTDALVIYVANAEVSGGSLVTVKDLNSDALLYVYKPTSTPAVGDVITIKGAKSTYNGSPQIGKAATITVLGTAPDSVPAISDVTVSEAKELPVRTPVRVEGIVSSIDTAWSAQYGNMSVMITDAAGNSMLAYRLKAQVSVGDKIAITGTLDNYQGNMQIGEGCVAELLVAAPSIAASAAQVLAGTTAESESTSVRLVLTLTAAELETLESVGAYVSITENAVANGNKYSTSYVYTSVNAGDIVKVAADGTYYVLVEIQNIPNANFGTTIYVSPFVTIGHTELIGAEVSFSVSGLIG